MRIHPRYLKIAGITLLSLIVIALVAGIIAYNKREQLLKAAIDKAIKKAKRDYDLNVEIGDASFQGLKTVELKNITVVPQNRDSLATIADLSVSVKLMPLLVGNIRLAGLKMFNSKISLIKKDSLRNYDFLFRKKKEDTTAKKTPVNLAELANKLLNEMLDKIPDDMSVKNFSVSFKDDNDSLRFLTTSAIIDNGDLKSSISVNNNFAIWHLNGHVDGDDKELNVKLFAEGKKLELPFLEKKYELKLNFDTVRTELKEVVKDGSELKLYGTWAVKNLLINQPKIASNDIIVPDGSIDANMFIGENYVSIDSSSVIHLEQVEARPFIKYTLNPTKIYELKLHTDELDAQKLFDAFPKGLFESLEGIKVSGKLQYDLNFYLDSSHPDSVKFDSRLNKRDFKVLNWGKTDFQKINHPFVYTPYEYGKPMRDIVIGPKNPDYTPINEISPDLKNALLTAEDPSFFSHKGFVIESLRKSIATNFKEKSFKRGGSTISMQLVKNVFLSREKNMARKIEEILIVWLIENTRLASKQRMFEVYLNLIEWGRNVYGIGEASRFYFGKHPSQITLGEGIFLASIVPRPKKGLYFFNGDGTLRTGLRGYFKLIGNLMAKRGLTERDTNAYGFYGVRLKESLRTEATPADTLITDSLLLEQEEEAGGNFFERLFGGGKKPDTLQIPSNGKPKVIKADTVKTPEQLRQERREERRKRRRQNNGGLNIF
ncbi:transglycosylase domain-containing protein [Rubrolithibacter danxiaensis]|uniref:transglycosylase domain-containing protein n=1 Tax=Rubrolithibacter danxiaensis TaxID=3390805 RepID=UPI003BF87F97